MSTPDDLRDLLTRMHRDWAAGDLRPDDGHDLEEGIRDKVLGLTADLDPNAAQMARYALETETWGVLRWDNY